MVDWLFRESPVPAVWLFSLVIAHCLALWREAGQQGRGRFAWLAMAIAIVLTALWMYLVGSMESGGEGALVTPNVWWWLVCRRAVGMGMVVPGMSPSSIFIFLGLYQPMTAGISQLMWAWCCRCSWTGGHGCAAVARYGLAAQAVLRGRAARYSA